MGCLFVLISPFVVYGLALLILPEAILGDPSDPFLSGDTLAIFLAVGWFVAVLTVIGGMMDD